jgi:antitoxin CcdA
MGAIVIESEDIRRTRKARGITQEEAARQVGIDRTSFCRWENGQTTASPDAAKRLAEWLAKDESSDRERPAGENRRYLASVSLPERTVELADELGADLSQLLATIGLDAVRKELNRLWAEQNAEAIKTRNAYFEKHGLPLEKYRTW